jgi:hypothetical protein
MKILELKGHKALHALNGFSALLLGLKMLPLYLETPYEEFYQSFLLKSEGEKETALRQALSFVQLQPDEIEAIASFAVDPNGVPYSSTNLKGLPLETLFEIIVSVCLEIGKIQISIVSEAEKKKYLVSQSTSEGSI